MPRLCSYLLPNPLHEAAASEIVHKKYLSLEKVTEKLQQTATPTTKLNIYPVQNDTFFKAFLTHADQIYSLEKSNQEQNSSLELLIENFQTEHCATVSTAEGYARFKIQSPNDNNHYATIEPKWDVIEHLARAKILEIPQAAVVEVNVVTDTKGNHDLCLSQIEVLKSLLDGRFVGVERKPVVEFGPDFVPDILDELWMNVIGFKSLGEIKKKLHGFIQSACKTVDAQWRLREYGGAGEDFDSTLVCAIDECIKSGMPLKGLKISFFPKKFEIPTPKKLAKIRFS